MFDLDTTLDQIAIQSPANSGSLAATGKLGVDVAGDAGFDIYAKVKKGTSVSAAGFAAFSVNGKHGLYSVNLITGDLGYLGWLPYSVEDLAVDL